MRSGNRIRTSTPVPPPDGPLPTARALAGLPAGSTRIRRSPTPITPTPTVAPGPAVRIRARRTTTPTIARVLVVEGHGGVAQKIDDVKGVQQLFEQQHEHLPFEDAVAAAKMEGLGSASTRLFQEEDQARLETRRRQAQQKIEAVITHLVDPTKPLPDDAGLTVDVEEVRQALAPQIDALRNADARLVDARKLLQAKDPAARNAIRDANATRAPALKNLSADLSRYLATPADALAVPAELPPLTPAAAIAGFRRYFDNERSSTKHDKMKDSGAEEGAQDFIQAKLVEVLELARRQIEGTAPIRLDRRTTPEEPHESPYTHAAADWYHLIRANGLCGGWVRVYRSRPDLFVKLWHAVESWRPTWGKRPDVVAELNDHIRAQVGSLLSAEPLEDVQALIRDAWHHMTVLEGYAAAPGPGSDDPLPLAGAAAGAAPPMGTEAGFTRRLDRREVAFKTSARTMLDHLARRADHLPVILTIETNAHHMAVQLDQPNGEQAPRWVVVETELLGVGETTKIETAAGWLQKWLDAETKGQTAADPFELTLWAKG